ncbi:MAG TPA: P27 family phage terminase small subunit [Arenicellales bacterium]|nr:P27 family phage terminase small subunit [Arenicellales bacterium]
MARGRRAQPDALKAAKGNPGRRKLQDQIGEAKAPALLDKIEYPAFLTHDRERELFRRIVEDFVLRRIARPPDLTAYARWAHYIHRWMLCKETLDGKATWYETESNHGKMLRRHPMFKDQLDLERILQSLEDRLGLNPVARQNIIRGLAAVPPALTDLFDEHGQGGEDRPQDSGEKPADESPVGVLLN